MYYLLQQESRIDIKVYSLSYRQKLASFMVAKFAKILPDLVNIIVFITSTIPVFLVFLIKSQNAINAHLVPHHELNHEKPNN